MTTIREYVADHEAAHASAAARLGLRVISLRITPSGPDDPYEGITHTMYPDNPWGWRKRMMVLLAPLVDQGEEPAWPPRALASRTDERYLHALATALDLDRRGYKQVVNDTVELTEQPEYKRLKVALSHAAINIGPVLSEPVLNKFIEEFGMTRNWSPSMNTDYTEPQLDEAADWFNHTKRVQQQVAEAQARRAKSKYCDTASVPASAVRSPAPSAAELRERADRLLSELGMDD